MSSNTTSSKQLITDDAQWLQANLRRTQLVMSLMWVTPAVADVTLQAMEYEKRRAYEKANACGCIGGWLMWKAGFDMNKFINKHADPMMMMTCEIANKWHAPVEDVYRLFHPWDRSNNTPNPWWPVDDYTGYKEEAVAAMLSFADKH